MSMSFIDFGKLLSLVAVSLLSGVGLGLSLTARSFHLDPLIAILSGAVVCLLITALIDQVVLADARQ